jgi:hypothetical protein
MNEENELDDLFKKRLTDPADNESYNEANWDAMEQMLDKRKKRRGMIYWLPVYSSVAALLLLFFGYLALRQKTVHPQGPVNPQAAVHQSEHSGKNGGSIPQQPGKSTKGLSPVVIAKNLGDGRDGNRNKPFFRSSADGAGRATGIAQQQNPVQTANRSDEYLSELSSPVRLGGSSVPFQAIQMVTLPVNNAVTPTASHKNTATAVKTTGYRPQLALSVMAAPDINGVGSFQQSKVGTNEGLLFSVGLSRKFTVSTGAIYSVKPYITAFANYHTGYQFPVDPLNVTADCRMLDVPINIGYQVYNRHQNSISIGTGLSSYIMLHESFKFNYANTYYTGPAQYTVPSTDGYYFGILNLNATFQHQVNSKVGFTVQPYVKLPLTTVGYSQVRLQTTGVAVGLTWNISSSMKP